MNRGSIAITENDNHEFIVKAKLVDGNLWLTIAEIAYLFNVYVGKVDSNMRSIFKSEVLDRDNVTLEVKSEHNGRECYTTLYNLEALIFFSYRISSFEARAFREWVMKALCEYSREDKKSNVGNEVLVMINLSSGKSSVVPLS